MKSKTRVLGTQIGRKMRSHCPFLPFGVIQVTPSKADGALLLFPWTVISEVGGEQEL